MSPRHVFVASCRGVSLLEILLAIAIVAALGSLLFSATRSVMGRSNQSKCIANLKTISVASATYSADHRGDWPPSKSGGPIYSNALIPYLGDVYGAGDPNFMKSPFICPASRQNLPEGKYRHLGVYTPSSYTWPDGVKAAIRYGLTYAQNVFAPGSGNVYSMPNRAAVQRPSRTMLYIEYDAHYIVNPAMMAGKENGEALALRHGGLVNVAFADGSVRVMTYLAVLGESEATVNPFWHGKGQ